MLLCYERALPFFRPTLAGDIIYSASLFGTLALAEAGFPMLREPAPRRLPPDRRAHLPARRSLRADRRWQARPERAGFRFRTQKHADDSPALAPGRLHSPPCR